MAAIKVALVTGSGKMRVGWHVAQALADRGYALAIHYQTSTTDAAETVANLQRRGLQAIAGGTVSGAVSDVATPA